MKRRNQRLKPVRPIDWQCVGAILGLLHDRKTMTATEIWVATPYSLEVVNRVLSLAVQCQFLVATEEIPYGDKVGPGFTLLWYIDNIPEERVHRLVGCTKCIESAVMEGTESTQLAGIERLPSQSIPGSDALSRLRELISNRPKTLD